MRARTRCKNEWYYHFYATCIYVTRAHIQNNCKHYSRNERDNHHCHHYATFFFFFSNLRAITLRLTQRNDQQISFLLTGTSKTNTVCEACAQGYYSSSFSALDTCARHQECALGETVILNGSVYHDTVCGTCEDFSSGGLSKVHTSYLKVIYEVYFSVHSVSKLTLFTGEAYRRVLSAFFSTQKMRLQKLKKFVSR